MRAPGSHRSSPSSWNPYRVGDPVEESIDELARLLSPIFLRPFDGFVQDYLGWGLRLKELVGGQAQNRAVDHAHPRDLPVDRHRLDLGVDLWKLFQGPARELVRQRHDSARHLEMLRELGEMRL